MTHSMKLRFPSLNQ
ncbi:erythromycin resistance leader peptide [Metabacillus rhizosphaerae]